MNRFTTLVHVTKWTNWLVRNFGDYMKFNIFLFIFLSLLYRAYNFMLMLSPPIYILLVCQISILFFNWFEVWVRTKHQCILTPYRYCVFDCVCVLYCVFVYCVFEQIFHFIIDKFSIGMFWLFYNFHYYFFITNFFVVTMMRP